MDSLEKFETQIWYFENTGYHTPERKLFTTEHQYKKSVLQYNERHCDLSRRLEALYLAIQQAYDCYNRELKSFEDLNNGKVLVEMPVPILAKTSSLDDVENTLETYEPFYSIVPYEGYENVYEQINIRKKEILFKVRFEFIEEAMKSASENHPIVFIESSFDPLEEDCDNFYDSLEILEKDGGSVLPRLYNGLDLEWIAFDSRSITHERLTYLATEWHGNPDTSKVFYRPN
jgi:hypothetical protein